MLLYALTVSLILGIGLSLNKLLPAIVNQVSLNILLLVLVIMGIVVLLSKRNKTFNILACITMLLFGIILGLHDGPSAEERVKPYYDQQITVHGKVELETIRQSNGYTSFVIMCSNGPLHGVKLRTSVKGEQGERLQHYDTIKFTGIITPLQTLRNPGGFDAITYNRVNHIGGRLEKASVVETYNDSNFLNQLTKQCKIVSLHLANTIRTNVGDGVGALLIGMMLGGANSQLDDDVRDIFSENGLSHLLSVSGTHLMLLASFLSTVLGYIPIKKKWIIQCLLLVCLLLYAMLCGFRAPILRALIMSIIVLFGGPGANRGRLLCLAVIGLLLYEPLWLFDIGMQLSVGATAGLIWLVPSCECLVQTIALRISGLRVLFPKTNHTDTHDFKLKGIEQENSIFPDFFCTGMAVTISAQLATLPLMIYYFHQISIISLISNIVLVPILEVSLLFTATALLFGFLGMTLIQMHAFQMSEWLITQVMTQADLLASLPCSTLTIGALQDSQAFCCAVLYYLVLGLWAKHPVLDFIRPCERLKMISLSIVFILVSYGYQLVIPKPFAAYFLDVGQGDCTVLVTPKRQVIIYDTGGLKGLDTGSRVIAPFLRYMGITKVDLLILSHYDYENPY